MGLPPIFAASQLANAGSLVASAATELGGNFADLLQSALKGGKNDEASPAATDPATSTGSEIATLKQQTDEAVQMLSARLRGLLSESGVDTTTPIQVQLDELGTIRVLGDHPDAQQIEALLAGEIDFTNDFAEIASSAEFLQSIDAVNATLPRVVDGAFTLTLSPGSPIAQLRPTAT